MLHEAAPIRQQHPGCPSGLLLRWQQDSYQRQPHAPAPRLRCCGELPSGTGQFAAPQEKKPKECELSLREPQHNGAARTIWETLLFHASSSPKCMDVSVDHKANFCLIFFLLYFNNRLQKMQGTSLLENIFPLHLSTTKDC